MSTPQLTPFYMYADSGRNNTYSIGFPLWVDALVLTGNTAVTYTLPAGAKRILFNCTGGSDFYCCATGTATVPGSSVTDGSASELNPTVRYINPQNPNAAAITSISLISPTSCTITIACFSS